MYVDPDGEFIIPAIIIGAAIGAYIGGSVANDGQMNPGQWNWESGHTWAGMGIGAVMGGAGGYGFAVGGPALAGTAFFGNFIGGTAAAYTIAGGVSMGVAGYGAGFGSAMLRTKGNWGYSHQAGMFGMKVGGSIGSVAGGAYGLSSGVDFSMPEYEAPPSLEWNKTFTASSNSGYGLSNDKYLNKLPFFSRSRDFSTSTDVQNMEHILYNMRSARQNGADHIDMREIFLNFPSYGANVDLAGITTILGSRVPMHINMAVYDNMNIGFFEHLGMSQNYFNGVKVNGFMKRGNWQLMRFSRYEGNIPMMWIHSQHNNSDLLFDYIYR